MVTIFDNMTLCTDAEVQRLLPQVPLWRQQQALRFRHTFGRFACLQSYLLLHDMLLQLGAISPDEPIEFIVNEYGKPYLKGKSDLYFSISHCHQGIAVAVENQEVGIDIEQLRNPSPSLLRFTMNPQEQQEISSDPEPARLFTRYWTQKEALAKWQGTGIKEDLQSLRTTLLPHRTLRTHETPTYICTEIF